MKILTLLVFFFYSAAIYSTDLLTRPVLASVPNTGAPTKVVMSETILADSIQSVYTSMNLQRIGLSAEAFRFAMIGYMSLGQQGKLNGKGLLTIIDFTKPSTEKRFYTLDLLNRSVKFHTYVSHGRNSGDNIAKSFSNKVHSNASSLGFYITGETYVGSKGYSMRLDGMDPGYNDKVRERAVVVHDAEYVSEKWINAYGRLGRSQGCPALPKEISKTVIDTIKDKSLVFAYYNDKNYLAASQHLKVDALLNALNAPVLTAE